MANTHAFLETLALVLGVAAVTTVVFQRLKQPVVLGYILAGLIVGPHLAFTPIANTDIVHTLSELGVILLMFALGLEFSLRKLMKVGPTAAVTAVIQCSLMIWLGFVTGRAFGWTTRESIFAGAIIAISSTTIIAKVFDEQNIRGKLREIVVGVLIVEDLIAILLMATLTAIASGNEPSAGEMANTVFRLAVFLTGLVVGGLFIVPRTVRFIVRLKRPETTLVFSIGLCFAVALLAQNFGYSVALGAFLAGSLVAESGHEKRIEHLVQPVRDVFAAIFFVSVGMLLDPKLVQEHWVAVVVLTLVVVLGKVIGVAVGAFLSGHGTRTSIQAGMSLAQIGEFSFIIAALGLSLKATGEFLYPVAVAVSAITTLLTPWLIRAADPVANFVDRKLPKPLQTFVTLYGSWLEGLSQPGKHVGTPRAAVRQTVRFMFLDAALLAALFIGTALYVREASWFLQRTLGFEVRLARIAIWAAAAILGVPFVMGILRLARKLGVLLAESALPGVSQGKVDLAAAPRRALVVTLQLGSVLMVGIPLMTITQPFLPGFGGAALLASLLVALGVIFWRSATNLEGHVRAGAQVVAEALAAQSATPAHGSHTSAHGSGPHNPSKAVEQTLSNLGELIPGLGAPEPFALSKGCPVVGKTLAELNLRGTTGATVLAIRRGTGVVVPSAQEHLQEGDILALAGSHDAIDAAKALLAGVPALTAPEDGKWPVDEALAEPSTREESPLT